MGRAPTHDRIQVCLSRQRIAIYEACVAIRRPQQGAAAVDEVVVHIRVL
jgi:hypothetical protein